MSINLDGILLPITTPFTTAEAVDAAGLATNIDRWNATGITGYVILGSTGERVNLDEREYVEVIEIARRAVPREMTFIVGASQQSTRGTIREIEHAADAGAQAVLVITPHYYRSAITQDALVSHYASVADAAPVPVILYSMPDLTGIKIQPETVAALSKHKNIIGIKDSSADIAQFVKTMEMVSSDFAVLIGNGTVLAETLRAGARGGILAVGSVAPELCVEIFRAVRDGKIDRAMALQEKLTPLALAVTKTYGVGGLKAAMELAGYVGGRVRAPLQPPSEAALAEIRKLLAEAKDAISADQVSAASLRGAIRNS